jgi:hypothetical protein
VLGCFFLKKDILRLPKNDEMVGEAARFGGRLLSVVLLGPAHVRRRAGLPELPWTLAQAGRRLRRRCGVCHTRRDQSSLVAVAAPPPASASAYDVVDSSSHVQALSAKLPLLDLGS